MTLQQALEWCMRKSSTWAFGVGPRGDGYGAWLRVGARTVEIPLPDAAGRRWRSVILELVAKMHERIEGVTSWSIEPPHRDGFA